MNDSAARLLDVVPETAQGQLIESVVRNTGLKQFIQDSLNRSEPLERELSLQQRGERFLQAHGTALRDAQGEQIGALVVLHDVTKLRRLEYFRRDFVGNVSHELRTPITLIKGFVETLADGALDDREQAVKFLAIINRHTDRLSDLIEDLLALSRLEQEESVENIEREQLPVSDLLDSFVQTCRGKADIKRIELEISCDPDLVLVLNTSLAEQAVINLVDNAIKYSDEGTTVRISAVRDNDDVLISVQDQGCGIAKRHLPRLFERFYRVDSARSRELGGTGLGLAIVKHIAQVHGGTVGVESELGSGSTFFIRLPGVQTA
jgi:two-component system phosphate regulon sensor histidine kinase PhoR